MMRRVREGKWRPGSANPLFSPFLYFWGKLFTRLSFDIIWRRKTFGRENIPPAGTPVIFAANHRSLADPNLVGTMVPYPIHYFAKEGLFRVPLLGWYIRRVNAFPVRRAEQDVAAFRHALEILQNGEGLLLFPEGGRRWDPQRCWKAKAGVGLLACKTSAQVVPVGIKNSDRFTRLAQVQVRFGKPIAPPPDPTKEDYQRFSDHVMARIKELCEHE